MSNELSKVPVTESNALTKPSNGGSAQQKSDAASFVESGCSVAKSGFEFGAAVLNKQASENGVKVKEKELEAVIESGKTQVVLATKAAETADKDRAVKELLGKEKYATKNKKIESDHAVALGNLAKEGTKIKSDHEFRLEELKAKREIAMRTLDIEDKKIPTPMQLGYSQPPMPYYPQQPYPALMGAPMGYPQNAGNHYPPQHQMMMPPQGNYFQQSYMPQQNGFAPAPQYPQQHQGNFHPQQHTPTQLLAQRGGFGMYALQNTNNTAQPNPSEQALEFGASSLQFGSNH